MGSLLIFTHKTPGFALRTKKELEKIAGNIDFLDFEPSLNKRPTHPFAETNTIFY